MLQRVVADRVVGLCKSLRTRHVSLSGCRLR
jgi:hypothetical protein